jgi:hypothetical protein
METKNISKIDRFFRLLVIKNYKGFFHLLGLAVIVSQILLFNREILTLNKDMLFIQILLLVINFYMVNWLLQKLGINKLMSDEYEKLTK